MKLFPVEYNAESRVEIHVVFEHLFDVLTTEDKAFEYFLVWYKGDFGTPAPGGFFQFLLRYQCSLGKFSGFGLSVTGGFDPEIRRERIDCLGSYSVKSDRFFKGAGIILSSGVHFRNHIHHLTQRNSASVIPDGYPLVLN